MRPRGLALAGFALLALTVSGCPGGGGGDADPSPETAPTEREPNDDPGAATAVPEGLPFEMRGEISARDLDHFRIDVVAPGELAVRLDLPADADHDLALLDGDGRRLATARADNTDPAVGPVERLCARVPAGVFHLVVIGHAGAAGDYRLRAELRPYGAVSGSGGEPAGPMRGPRCFHGAAPTPGGGAVVGGGTSKADSKAAALLSAVGTTEIFDPETGAFSDGPGLGASRFGVTATALADGRVLFAGGDVGGTAAVYDPPGRRMVRTDIPLAGGNRFLHTATPLPDGRVLLAGGVRFVIDLPPRAEPLATTAIFDPKTLSSTAGPPLRAARLSHAACPLPDGRVLITGGEGRRDTEIVDVRGGTFESVPGPALTGVRDDHTATALADGRVLVTGGQDARGRSLDTAEVLEGGAFRALDSRLATGRSDHLAVALPDGRVLLIGGEYDDGGPDEILGTVDVYDPATGAIAPAADLAVPRDDSRAVLLLDGRVLVTGGESAASLGIADAERYSAR